MLYVCNSGGPTVFGTRMMPRTPYSHILPASAGLAHNRVFKYRYKRCRFPVRPSPFINSNADFISDTMNNRIVINDRGSFANATVSGTREIDKSIIPADQIDEFTCSSRLDILLGMHPVSEQVQLEHAWNPNDMSPNIFIKEEDNLTFQRNRKAQSTDCVRGKTGFTKGLHVWEVKWPTNQRGTHAVIGVATQNVPLHLDKYQSILGNNDQSWGWDLERSVLYHGSKTIKYPGFLKPNEILMVPEKFLVALDMDEGTLSFIVNDQYLGVAFKDLKGQKLFPIVNVVWGNCEIRMKYIGGLKPEPVPMMALCRHVIIQQIGKSNIMNLDLPHSLKNYLLYMDRR